VYSLNGFKLTTDAKGASLPGGELNAKLGADIMAQLSEQQVAVKNLSLNALGIKLNGTIDITDLDTEPNITGQLSAEEFNPREMFEKLGIEAPVTADPDVLSKASLSLALTATPASAALNDLTIKLDDTTFSGTASVPSLAATMPPLRFKFGVDAIDLDRYLPPPVVGDDAEAADAGNADAEVAATDGDAPIELPLDLLRELDVDGEFSVGSVKVSNLTTTDIVIPVKAKDGVLGVEGLQALLYEGNLSANAKLDATADIPVYGVDMQLDGIQAEPLLGDLLQDDSFLSGQGEFAVKLDTTGNSVNALTSALNGKFNTAFNDGSINGINLGYQIRRAKAALTGKKLDENADVVKTDFSSLSVSGIFTDGVMTSDDLDMRSPLLRIDGAGKVDLPGEQVDYTLNTLITGSSQGQGGKDLESLKGVKLAIPIRGSFDELANDFAGVILQGMKDNISGNLKNQAKALADQEAAKLKAKAKEAEAKLKAEAKEKLKAQEAAAKDKLKAEADKAADKVKDKLKGLLK
jgi:AsmA protein